jgi:hypothetical protein
VLTLPELTFFTEAMAGPSGGYFDLRGDLPPWDTWIAYYFLDADSHVVELGVPGRHVGSGCLLCWVPAVCVAAAERGLQEDELGNGDLLPAGCSAGDVLGAIVDCFARLVDAHKR